MKADIILRNSKKRNSNIATKIRVTKDDGTMIDYACVGSQNIPSSTFSCLKYHQGKWLENAEKNPEVIELLRNTFSRFVEDSRSLYKRKMKDSKGSYYIMYKDSFVDDDGDSVTPTLTSEDWHMKVADSYVVVKQKFNDYTKKYEYTYLKRAFGKPDSELVQFQPKGEELERIVDMIVLGDKIRRAKNDEYSRTKAMIRNVAARPYYSHNQKTFISLSNRERSMRG